MSQIELSSIDYIYTTDSFVPITFKLRFPERLEADRLIDAFWSAAERFAGVAGALRQRDEFTCYLDTSERHAEVGVVDVDNGWSPGHVRTGFGSALARVEIGFPAAGGTVVAISMSHVISDGYGFFLFLSAWASAARGAKMLKPNLDRGLLRGAAQRMQGQSWGGSLPFSGFFLDLEEAPRSQLPWRELLVESDWLATQTPGLSENDLLCAALWKRSVASGQVKGSSTLTWVADFRRYRPELGPLFFGNAVMVLPLTMDVEAIRAASKEELATQIREITKRSPNHVQDELDELEAIRAAHGVGVFRKFRSMRQAGLMVTNLSRVPYDGLDFGCGRPSSVEPVLLPATEPIAVVLSAEAALRVTIAEATR